LLLDTAEMTPPEQQVEIQAQIDKVVEERRQAKERGEVA
jgi:hypothetical protein